MIALLSALLPFALLFGAGYIGHQTSKLAIHIAAAKLRDWRMLKMALYAIFAAYLLAGAAVSFCVSIDPAIVWTYPIPFVALTACLGGAMLHLGVSYMKMSYTARLLERAMAERSDAKR